MLAAGTRIGPYEVVSAIGAGGMGEVYRARDTRLGRDVAIKVLPQHLSSNPDLKARFEREARAISALSHPQICHLYDIGSQDGTDYLVMELLEGDNLAQRLEGGPLPLKQALEYGIEIAEALDKAHKNGIVHRDLKPGNIMLTKSGAKLLDFGLAKPTAGMAAMASGSMETMSKPLTGEGKIVGTFHYMAPEQIHGQNADARTDIFALGVVLYEMVTGKRAFQGKSQISVMSAILEKDPEPLSTLQPLTPPALDHVIQRALAKDPEERWQSVADVKAELKWIAENRQQAATGVRAANRTVASLVSVCAFLLIISLLAGFYLLFRSTAPAVAVHAYIPAPENTNFQLLMDDAAGPVVISPQGTHIAFTAAEAKAGRRVWVRPLSGDQARPLAGTDGATYPFWSPDGKWLGFFAEGKLKKVSAQGGPVFEVTDVLRPRGGSWGPGDIILFAPDTQSAILAVPASGGVTRAVTRIDSTLHTTHRWPQWLPDGKRFLYLATNHGSPAASNINGIYVASLDGKENRMLLPADSNVAVARDYLLYAQGGTLMAQPFDVRRARLTGDAMAAAQNVVHNPGTWRSAFDVSHTGILVYQAGSSAHASQLLWRAPDKSPRKAVTENDAYWGLRLAPDARRLAVTIGNPHADLWIFDLARDVKTRFTFSGSSIIATAAWSPDGARLAFSQAGPGGLEIYVKDAGGSGKDELLVSKAGNGTTFNTVADWSKDGRYLLYYAISPGSNGLWVLPMTGERKPKLFLSEQRSVILQGRFSPDGKWVAYVSGASGQLEAYVTSFPDANGKWQVSSGGAVEVHWLADGRGLLYERPDGTLLRVAFSTHGNDVEIGAARTYVTLKPIGYRFGGVWDVAQDGRVIVNETLGAEDVHAIDVVANWTEELKK